MKNLLALVLAAMLGAAAPVMPDPLEAQARRFVTLATSLGHLRPREVDAYWGPPELDMRKRGPMPSLGGLRQDLIRLRGEVGHDAPSVRQGRLAARLDHVIALVGVIEKPHALGFDQEARQVYGLAMPLPDKADSAHALATLNRLLPGRGDLTSRLAAWRARFMIPEARRKAVFLRALAECRARTLGHRPLPPDERLDVVWSADVAAAWHRYQGHHRSRLEINPAAVADPGSALDVACHEAYPGHHAQFLAMDTGTGGFPVEDTVVILRSPEQVLREGAASYGVDLAFPASDRLVFTRDVLFPLAGFDRRQAASFLQVHRAVAELARSVLPILRDYYDGRAASGDAMARLVLDAQVSSPAALLEFTRDMGAMVAGYTVIRDMVAACVSARASGPDRWQALRQIVAGPEVTLLDGSACAKSH